MENDEIRLIAEISDQLETRNNEFMKDVLEAHDNTIAMNVLINTATSMLAKALILCHPESRAHVQYVAMQIIDAKVAEGHAAVESLMAIGKAMGKD
jgi:hypothetical protein